MSSSAKVLLIRQTPAFLDLRSSWTSPFVYSCQFHLDELCSTLLRTQTHSQKNSRYTDPPVKSGLFFPLTVFNHSCYFFKWHEDQNSIQYPKIHCWQSEEVSVAVSCGSIVLMSKDFLRCRWDFLLRSVQTLYRNTKDFVLNGYTEKTEAHIFFVTGTEMVIELEHWQSSEFLQSYSSGCTAWPLKPGTFLSISFLMCIPLIKYVIVKGILDLRADSLLLSLWKLHRM